MTTGRRPAGAKLVRLYPAAWRARYEDELLAVLELGRIGGRGRLDLVRGAIDARLHEPTRLPALAALVAGGSWAFAGAQTLAQPAPPDWPGYTLDTLPFAIVAVVAGLVTLVGLWALSSDRTGRAGRAVIAVAILGQAVWLVALAAALGGIGYGWETAVAQAVGVLGIILVGAIQLRDGARSPAGVLVLSTTLILFGWPGAWLAFGLAWTLVGTMLLSRSDPAAGVEG